MSTTSTAPADAPAAPAAVAPVQPSLPLTPAAIPPALAAMLPQTPAAPAPPAAAEAPAAPAKSVEPPKAQRDAEARLAAIEAELATARQAARVATVRELVTRTATTAGAINADQIHKLLADDFDVTDDGRVLVKGDPRAVPSEHIARFLAANLHLLRPALTGGGAGTPAAVVSPTGAQALSPHTREGGTAIAHRAMASLLGTAPAPAAATVPAAAPKG